MELSSGASFEELSKIGKGISLSEDSGDIINYSSELVNQVLADDEITDEIFSESFEK